MTQVDFYVLGATDAATRYAFACRLTDKALRSGRRVVVAVDTAEQALEMDKALWDFRPESFVPHRRDNEQDRGEPVLIDARGDCADHHDVLVNLRSELPDYFSRFQRLAEVVVQSPEVLEQSRTHWAFFQQRGYPVQHHKLG